MTETTFLNYTTADFSTKADMEIRIYRRQEQRDKHFLAGRDIGKPFIWNFLQSFYSIFISVFVFLLIMNF